jgi:signal transduction histidine kinase
VSVVAGAHDVRRSSVRVALATTAVVAVVYVAIAVAVMLIVTGNLTHQVDDRLTGYLAHPVPGVGDGDEHHGLPGEPGDRPFGPQLLIWLVRPDGAIVSDLNASPPASALAATSPTTTTINGTSIRVAGTQTSFGHLLVGQDLTDVNRTQSTLFLAEVIIGPILLLAVFLGAVAIGRRVATPIEIARRRQLEFTADASHELRTPLSVIEANASLALQQERSEAWYRATFARVDHEAKRMHRLVDDLLWLARFDATQAAPSSEPVDLAALAGQTVDRFTAIAQTRSLRLSVNATGDDPVVAAPPEWLDRLLGVLVDNACKYSPDGGTVAISIDARDGRVSLAVEDGGPGIPEAERPRIFDRFHRATDTRGGAGLGLAIADAIVRATQGRWSVGESAVGGARMSVTWPAAFGGPRTAPGGARARAGAEATR